jgi:hypothetical protein
MTVGIDVDIDVDIDVVIDVDMVDMAGKCNAALTVTRP